MNKLSDELLKLSALPDFQKAKVEVGILREELSQKTQYRALATASLSMLAWFADNTTISFEERKNIDALITSMEGVQTQNRAERATDLNSVLKLASHYNR